jgi:hypothetical protein
MEWWGFWFRSMKVVPVYPDRVIAGERPRAARTAQFFSGGIDSFFTALRHQDATDPLRANDLLFGWGLDEHPLDDNALFSRLSTRLGAAADKLDKCLVVFTTNLRHTRFRRLPWGPIAHGNALAAAALLLQQVYSRVLIPSTDGYRETGIWGSHASVDHFYSTTNMRVVHDGAAYSRFQKTALVASSPIALSTLRVCWHSGSDTNCGQCEKCVRTMIALELCGALSKAPSFQHATLDLDRVARVYCPPAQTGSLRLYYEEMLHEATQRHRGDLATAIKRALGRASRRRLLLALARRLGRFPLFGRWAGLMDTALRRPLIT